MTDSSSQPPGQPPAGPPTGQGYPQQQYQKGAPSYATGPPQGPSGPRASFGQRLGAYLLDLLVIGVPFAILMIVLVVAIGPDEASGEVDEGAAGILVLLYILGFIALWAYYVVLEGGPSGQTIGKKAVGIRVVSMQTGGPIGYGKAFIRTLIRTFISGNVCLLGFLWMLWDQEKQTWHDKISDSVVVPVSAYPIQR